MTGASAQLFVPIFASLGAALVAGAASYLAGRGMRSHEWKLGIVRERLFERQRLYAKFIAEADRNLLVIASTGVKSVDNVMPLLALYGEISLLSTDAVQRCARRVCDLGVLANGADGGEGDSDHFAAKSAFIDAARDELRVIGAGKRSTSHD